MMPIPPFFFTTPITVPCGSADCYSQVCHRVARAFRRVAPLDKDLTLKVDRAEPLAVMLVLSDGKAGILKCDCKHIWGAATWHASRLPRRVRSAAARAFGDFLLRTRSDTLGQGSLDIYILHRPAGYMISSFPRQGGRPGDGELLLYDNRGGFVERNLRL